MLTGPCTQWQQIRPFLSPPAHQPHIPFFTEQLCLLALLQWRRWVSSWDRETRISHLSGAGQLRLELQPTGVGSHAPWLYTKSSGEATNTSLTLNTSTMHALPYIFPPKCYQSPHKGAVVSFRFIEDSRNPGGRDQGKNNRKREINPIQNLVHW